VIQSICRLLSSSQLPLPRGVQIVLSLIVATAALAATPSALAQAVNDSFTAQEDSSGNSFDVLVNDTSIGTRTIVGVTTPNRGGSVNIVGGGPGNTLSYTPAGNFSSPPTETFTYTMEDSAGGSSSAQVTVTVNPLPDPTTAQNDSYSTNEDATLNRGASQGVLGNDSDPDGSLTASVVSGVSNGNLNLNSNGSFSYTPDQDFFGSDGFVYEATDGSSTDQATVTITVNSVNDAPDAADDSYSVNEDSTLNVNAQNGVLANDTDVEDGTPPVAVLANDVGDGTLTLSSNGSFSYAPAPDFSGTDRFTYRARDSNNALSPPATVTITVNGDNDPPTASNDGYSTDEGMQLSVNAGQGVLRNDNDPDPGDDLDAVLQSGVSNGTLNLNQETGAFTYTPDAAFLGGQDSFTYVARDSSGVESNEVTVTIDVISVNDPPVANPDSYSTDEETALTVGAPGVLGNDTDEEDGRPSAALLASNARNGSLTLNSNGSFSYTPNAEFEGDDSFSYRARDSGNAQSAPATVTIRVEGVNDPPTARPDSYNTDEDTTLSVNAAQGVLANDEDPDSVLTAVLVNDVDDGSLTLNRNGSFTYTPDLNFNGVDRFTYRASDGEFRTGAIEVTISIRAINDPATGSVPDQSATENVPFVFDVTPLFSDPEGDSFTIEISDLPDGLTASGGTIDGMPAVDSGIGNQVVRVRTTDSQGAQFQTTFDINVVMAGRADLTLNVTANPSPALIGQDVSWDLEVLNQSSEPVSNIAIEMIFSGEVPFTPTNAPDCIVTPLGAATELNCTALMDGSTATVSVTGNSTQAGDMLAQATVRITDFVPIEQNPDDDSANGALNVAQRLSATPAQKLTAVQNRHVAVDDLNGDGFPDLVVATGVGESTRVYPNEIDPDDPDGIKRALALQPMDFGSQGPSTGLGIADFNGDGALDIVTASGATQANQILLNQNPGDGSFGFDVGLDELGPDSDVSNAVAVADINGDMAPDVVFGNASPNRVFTNGGGVFSETDTLGDADTVDVLLIDLFGDGLPELVVANSDGDAEVFANVNGTFQKELDLPTGPATSIAAGDLDGDGDIDLVLGRDQAVDGIPSNLLLMNTSMDGAGSFFPAGGLGASPSVDMLVLDLDDDLDLDIISINATGGHQIYVNSGNGQFTLHPELFASAGALAAAAGKFSLDDRTDVAVIGAAGSDIFFNDGLGNLGLGDLGPPIIQRIGAAEVALAVEDPYVDAGATAIDDVDGDLTGLLVVNNPVDTAVVGTYTVTYTVRDSSGNAAAPVTRTVTVGVNTPTGGGGGGAAGPWLISFLTCLAGILRTQRGSRRSRSFRRPGESRS